MDAHTCTGLSTSARAATFCPVVASNRIAAFSSMGALPFERIICLFFTTLSPTAICSNQANRQCFHWLSPSLASDRAPDRTQLALTHRSRRPWSRVRRRVEG
jgi:hypothetical protein